MTPHGNRQISPHVSQSVQARSPHVNELCHGYTGGVSEHEGHVIASPSVYAIYWDDYFKNHPDAISTMNSFIGDLVGDKGFIKRLAQYGVSPGEFSNSVLLGSSKSDPYPAPTSLTQDQAQSQLISWFGKVSGLAAPAKDETSKCYLIFAPQVTTLINGDTTGFCGYHHYGKYNAASTAEDLFWAIISGSPQYTNAMTGQEFVDLFSYCVGHEFAEMWTNRDDHGYYFDVSSGGKIDRCEIGDICEADSSGKIATIPYGNWQVERVWSQRDMRCMGPLQFYARATLINAFPPGEAQVRINFTHADTGAALTPLSVVLDIDGRTEFFFEPQPVVRVKMEQHGANLICTSSGTATIAAVDQKYPDAENIDFSQIHVP